METRNGHIVLIVDDSLLICEQIKASLKEENIFITEAHTGEEAEAMVKQYQPDLILLDVVLPDADGYTLFDRLKAVDQNGASILFLTSKDKDDDVVKGFSKGACDYIKKPFVRGELLSRVRAHLQLKQQKDELNRQNRELRSNMEKLNYMAFRDGLTGLYNRRYVVGDLVDDIKDHNREQTQNVLILADIDDFKKINDTYGHESGDIYIRETAVCMKGIPEDHAIVGRRSGDEFFILLFGYEDRNCVRKQLRDFYDILDKHPAVLPDGIQLKIQISSGIAWYGGELCTFEELVRCADIALYEAKSTMKGQTVEYRKG